MDSDHVRIAALADLHLSGHPDELPVLQDVFAAASRHADVLAICGDFTCHGRADELENLLRATAELMVPAVTVLGNHDHESNAETELIDLLTAVGIDVLDGTPLVVAGVGFAGVKASEAGSAAPG